MTPRFSLGKIVIPEAAWRKHFAKHAQFKRCFLAFDHTKVRHVSQHSQPLQRGIHRAIAKQEAERREALKDNEQLLQIATRIARSWAALCEAAEGALRHGHTFGSSAGMSMVLPADACLQLAEQLKLAKGLALDVEKLYPIQTNPDSVGESHAQRGYLGPQGPQQ